jgi:WD40 repeat protein
LPNTVASPPVSVALPRPVATLTGGTGQPEDVVFTPDGKNVVGALNPGRHLLVWEASSARLVNRLELPDGVAGCRGLALIPGERLASCFGTDPVVRVWDLRTGEQVRRLTAGKVNGFTSVAAFPDGRVLATAADKTVRLWEPGRDDEPRRFDIKADVRGLAVLPDGKRFVVGCGDKTVRLWDVTTGAEVRTLPLKSLVWRLAVSPDGHWAAFGNGNVVQLWQVDTGATKTLSGPKAAVDGVTFTREGRYVLAGSADHGLYGWELATGRMLGRVMEHGGPLRGVALAPDGKRLVTSASDGTAVVWQLAEVMGR